MLEWWQKFGTVNDTKIYTNDYKNQTKILILPSPSLQGNDYTISLLTFYLLKE